MWNVLWVMKKITAVHVCICYVHPLSYRVIGNSMHTSSDHYLADRQTFPGAIVARVYSEWKLAST